MENAEIYDEILKIRIFAPVQPDRTTTLRWGVQYGVHLRSFCRVFSNKIIQLIQARNGYAYSGNP